MRGISRILGFILVFLLLTPNQLMAQEEEDTYFNYRLLGLKYGWSISSVALQPSSSEMRSDYGYSAGLVYVFSDSKNLGLQLELQFSSRQWIEYFNVYQAKTELQYIELPLMTNINMGSGRLKYIINLGTYIAVNIGTNKSTNIPQGNAEYQGFMDRSESSSDFGLLLGGGLRYLSKLGVFQLDARYALGYQKLYNENVTSFSSSNMSVISLNVAYLINIKKNDK